jgi:hypothetical protein
MDLLKLRVTKRFIGADFLTWLWFQSEAGDGLFELDGLEPFTLYVGDQIVLSAEHSDARENVLRKGNPANCAEAGAALAVGKKVARIKFRLETDEGDCTFTLDADDLDFRALRLPTPQTVNTVERVIERMEMVLHTTAIIDALFALFLELRLGRDWERKSLQAMRRWVRVKDGVEEEPEAGRRPLDEEGDDALLLADDAVFTGDDAATAADDAIA